MCQTNNKLVKLRKDRVAYKVGYVRKDHFKTGFQFNLLPFGKEITAKGKNSNPNYEINSGFFHCCETKRDAKELLGKLLGHHDVIKIIIPHKDNIVYRGDFEQGLKSICARKIILTDEVVK